MTEVTTTIDDTRFFSDNAQESSGEGAEIAPYHYSTDSTVSMETEDSHDSHNLISDSPITSRSMSNFHMTFCFLDEQENIQEEVEQAIEQEEEQQQQQDNCSDFEFVEVDEEVEELKLPDSSLVGDPGGMLVRNESNGSTAEELDTAPFDSGTTDPGNLYEGRFQNGDEGIVAYAGLAGIMGSSNTTENRRSYENWSVIIETEEMNKRKKSIIRSKGSRIGVRQRAPQPLPRPAHLKQKIPRPPAPIPRKRRGSIRSRPPQRNITSEGDMEQADEMGDEGEGDDGFVDGMDTGLSKRKTKKKLSVLVPSLPVISPPSSPSNTPISRRRLSSRKNRAKPRVRKNSKPTLASADISTQETTTPGPPTSDSDNNNEEVDLITDSSHHHIEEIAEEDMSIRGTATSATRRQASSYASCNGVGSRKLESSSRTPSVESITKKNGKAQNGKQHLSKHQGSKTSLTSGNGSSVKSSSSVSRGKVGTKASPGPASATAGPLSSETSDNSDSEKGKKDKQTTPPNSGIPVSKNSPRMSRKASEQENHRPRGTRQAGTFVSKRLSVAAMINQFDTASPTSPKQSSPTVRNFPSPTKRTPLSNSEDNDAGSGSKPTPLNKPPPSKPELKPKPTSPVSKEASPTPQYAVVKKPVRKAQNSVKKDVLVSKPLPSASIKSKPLESTDSNSQVKSIPPLPPKPKSPPASNKPPLPSNKPANGGKTTPASSSSSSSSTSSIYSSSTSSLTKLKRDENSVKDDKKVTVKQPVVKKASVVRVPSNSSLSGKSSSTAAKPVGGRSPVSTQRKLSPPDEKSKILPNKLMPGTVSSGKQPAKSVQEKQQVTVNGRDKESRERSVDRLVKKEVSPVPLRSTKAKPTETKQPVSTSSSNSCKPKPPVSKPIDSVDSQSANSSGEDSKPSSKSPVMPATGIKKTSDNKPTTRKPPPDPLPPVDLTKPPIRPIKSSPRRPPPDPPVSPPGEGNKPKRPYPRVRSPPPAPPVSPKNKELKDSVKNDKTSPEKSPMIESPRNYEEFVPSFVRSSSMTHSIDGQSVTSAQSPPPSLQRAEEPVKTKGETSTNSLTTHSFSAYEDIELPVVNPEASLKRTSSFKGQKHSNGLQNSSSEESLIPPPLPPRNYPSDDPVISLPATLDPVHENETPQTSLLRRLSRKNSKDPTECTGTPPPLPSQPIPKRKSLIGGASGSPLLKRKEIISSASTTSLSSSPSPPVRRRKMENVYEEIPANIGKPKPSFIIGGNGSQHYEAADNFLLRPRPVPNYARDLSSAGSSDSIDGNSRRFSASVCVSTSSGLSPVSIRRANSDKMKNPRVPLIVTPMDKTSPHHGSMNSLQRTPSMDILDDRMNQSVRNSVTDPGYSSGEEVEEGGGTISPSQGLPQLPKNTYNLSPDQDSIHDSSDEEQEPLYQYINHADFTSTPWMTKSTKVSGGSTKSSSNQLEIARQLSVNHRKLWCEQPEVIRSGVLGTMSEQDKKLQEAMFEVITSEASYLRSLNVLIEHFMDDPGMNPNLPEDRRVITKKQFHFVFSNVREIRTVSEKFLDELRKRKRQSTVMNNICDIIQDHVEKEFGCYISYCTNQVYQMREITEMLYSNTMFIEYIKRLESHKRCQNLSITSFLLLPMQRITRLPLLVLAILNRLSSEHPMHSQVEDALRAVQKLVTACNDGARQMERTEELHQIHSQLNFAKLKPFPIVSISRRLERKGSLVLLEIEQRLFGKPRIRKVSVYVFAFTDYVLITKRKKGPKGEINYKVIDYGSKAVVEVERLKMSKKITYPKHTFGEHETVAKATWAVSTSNEPHAFLLMFLENATQKAEKYTLVCQNDTECTRWMESISHPAKEKQKEDEKIYESWDCPQVQAIYDYTGKQPDELSLVRGDIVKVLRKMADGWYEGEKLRDLQWGWFPSNFTVEIENTHTRARNLKERHRLLSTQLSAAEFSQQFSKQ